MGIIALLVISLFLAIRMFYSLMPGQAETGKLRIIDRFGLILGFAGIAISWFQSFFPYVDVLAYPDLSENEFKLLFWAELCAGLWILIVCSVFLFIVRRNRGRIERIVLGVLCVLLILCLIPLTIITLNFTKEEIVLLKGERRVVEAPMKVYEFSDHTKIPKNGSLCGTLGMTPEEALEFAKEYKLKYWHKRKRLYVLVFPGDTFMLEDSIWKPVEFMKNK